MTLIQYVMVDFTTGEIEASGFCPECAIEDQPESERHIKVIGCGTRATHYYTPLGLREYTPEQRLAKSTRPLHSNWDNGLMRWIDVRQIAELRAERWAVIKAARTAAIDAPIDTPLGRFDADAPSRAALSEALASTVTGFSYAWTTANNTLVTLEPADLAELLRLISQRTQQAHAQARALRCRIEAAATIEDLQSITWPEEHDGSKGLSPDLPLA